LAAVPMPNCDKLFMQPFWQTPTFATYTICGGQMGQPPNGEAAKFNQEAAQQNYQIPKQKRTSEKGAKRKLPSDANCANAIDANCIE